MELISICASCLEVSLLPAATDSRLYTLSSADPLHFVDVPVDIFVYESGLELDRNTSARLHRVVPRHLRLVREEERRQFPRLKYEPAIKVARCFPFREAHVHSDKCF